MNRGYKKIFRQGVLGPYQSGEYIAQNASHVIIHENGLEKLCNEMLLSINENGLKIPDLNADPIHPDKEHPRVVDWIFVTDALNFCFWSMSNIDQWVVDDYTGYYALEAALSRAIKEGYDMTDPTFYSKITDEQLQIIFRSDRKGTVIPLPEQRKLILHEVGNILIEKYNGTFETCLKDANKSGLKLLEIVVENFPCFRDEAFYKGQNVSFYKRAQILVADLWNYCDGKDWGEFYDIDKLTMFADYRVPQVLVYFGAMTYSEELMDKLKKDILLESGSEEEVEIRGCSIHAVELLKTKIKERLNNTNAVVPNSSLIDYFLWCYRRKHAKAVAKIPFHKTLGIYY